MVKLASLKLAPCKLACRQAAPLKIAPDKLASLKFAPLQSAFAKLPCPKGMLLKSSPAHWLVYHNKLTCSRLAAITDVANPKISPNETAPKVTDFLLFTFYNFKRFLISTSTRINFFRHSTPQYGSVKNIYSSQIPLASPDRRGTLSKFLSPPF